jgi:flagellar protein FliL
MMSEAENQPKKKSGKLRKAVLMLGLLLVGGGGTGAGLWAAGLIPQAAGAAEDPNRPKLVPRPGVSGDGLAAAIEKARKGKPDPRMFQPTYQALDGAFTSNLQGDSFVQIGLGVATYYDERVLEHLKTHDMAVRSAVLMTLGEQSYLTISTSEGKNALKTELKNAINGVLTNKEGFGGIDEVYFTSFVTQ